MARSALVLALIAGLAVPAAADTTSAEPSFPSSAPATPSVAESSPAATAAGAAAAADEDDDALGYSPSSGGTDRESFYIDAKGRITVLSLGDRSVGEPVRPRVASVELVSTPTADVDGDDVAETYKLGDVVRARVTFTTAVDVVGSPLLKLRFDPDFGEKSMTFDTARSRTNTTTLEFTYQVVDGNLSTQGIAFYANTLSVGEAVSIRATGRAVDANLDFAEVAHDAAHKVDGVPATLIRRIPIVVSTNSGPDRRFAIADTFDVTAKFTEPVTVTTAGDPVAGPRIRISLDSGTRWAGYAGGSGTSSLVFRYTVAAGDESTTGRILRANSLVLNGGTITDLAGNAARHQSRGAFSLSWRVDGVRPSVRTAVVDRATLELNWSEGLQESSVPDPEDFTVKVAGTVRSVAADGVAVAGSKVTLTLASAVDIGQAVTVSYTADQDPVRDVAGNTAANFADRKVTNATTSEVTKVELVSAAGPDDTYTPGDTVRVRVTFDMAVTVDTTDGTPRLKIDLDGDPSSGERWAAYASGSGRAELVFAYTVVTGDASAQGISVPADALQENGGTLRSPAGTDAKLDHPAVAASASHKVDGAAPTVSAVTVSGATLTLTYDEALDTAAQPAASAFTVKVDTEEVSLAATDPVAVAGSAVTLTLAAAVNAHVGVTVSYTVPAENPIRDRFGNAAAGLTDRAVTNTTPRPEPARATVGGAILALFYDGRLDTASEPAASDFTVTVAGRARGVSGVAVTDRYVILTLASAVSAGQAVTVSYTAGSNPIRDAVGSVAADLANRAVSHNRAPTYEGDTDLSVNVPAGTLVSIGVPAGDFRDPDGHPLTFAVSAERDDVYQGRLVYNRRNDRVFLHAKDDCDLHYLTPALPDPYDAVVTLTAADLHGATAQAMMRFKMTFDCPYLDSATVNGATLRLTYSEVLDTTATPAAGDFTVKVGGSEVSLAAVDPVAISSSGLTLTLAAAVTAGQTVTVSYTAGANPIRSVGGDAAAALTDEPVTNVTGDEAAPMLQSAAVEGASRRLTLTYDEALDPESVPASGAFTVKVNGAAVSLVIGDRSDPPVRISGAAVVLRLAAAVRVGHTVTVSYTAGTNPILDFAGNPALDLTDRAVVNTTGTPTVSEVALVSTPSADADGDATAETYVAGDVVRARVTMSQPVDVVGSPELKLQLGGAAGERTMVFDTTAAVTATTMLEFTYTVAAGDRSTAGIGFGANKLSVGAGASIRKAGQTEAANLAFAAVAASARHKVDAVVPELHSATVARAALVLSYHEALDTGSEPAASAFTVKVGGNEVSLAATDPVAAAGSAVTLTLASGVTAGQTVTVSYTVPAGNPIRDRSGNAAAGLTDRAVTNTTPRPELSRATVGGATLALFYDRTLDTASVPAASDFTVTVAGSARGVSGVVVRDRYVILTLASAVSAGQVVTVSYTAGANPIRDAAGSVAANLTNRAVSHNRAPTYEGDVGLRINAPSANLVSLRVPEGDFRDADGDPLTFTVSADRDDVYAEGDLVYNQIIDRVFFEAKDDCALHYLTPPLPNPYDAVVTLTAADPHGATAQAMMTFEVSYACLYLERATVNGATLRLTYSLRLNTTARPAAGDFTVKVGGSEVSLAAVDPVAISSSGLTLTLAAAVTAGQTVTVSYTAGANPIRSVGGDAAAALTDEPVTNVTGDEAAPMLQSAAVEGATRRLTLTYDEALDPESVPASGAFTVKVNGAAVSLVSGDRSDPPVRITGAAVVLRLAAAVRVGHTVTVSYTAGTNPIRDFAGNPALDLTDRAVVNTTGTPTVSEVALVSTPSADADGDATAETYVAGDVVRARVTMSQPVDVVGSPELKLQLGGAAGERTMVFDTTAAVTATTMLEFTYTVAAADRSTAGIGFGANKLSVGAGASIRKAGQTEAANLAFAAVAASARHKVDAVVPELHSATVARAALVLSYDEALDTGSEPAASAFTVKVGGNEVSLAATDPVAAAGSAVTLTLASGVTAGQTVTVSYTVPAGNPIRDRAGNAAAGLTDRAVTNTTPRPELSRATVGGATLALFYDRTLDTASVPAASDFTVTVAGSARGVSGVVVRDRYVILTLASAVSAGQVVTVSYTAGANPIRDAAGSVAANLTNQAVSHNRAPTYEGDVGLRINAPSATLVSLRVPASDFRDADGDPLTFTVSADRDDVYEEGDLVYNRLVDRVFFEAKENCALHNLTPPLPNPYDAVVTLTAADPHGATAQAMMTYEVSYVCLYLDSATVNGATLRLAYSVRLNTTATPAAGDFTVKVGGSEVSLAATDPVAVTGSSVTLTLAAAVTAGQAVTVSYTAGTNPIRSLIGAAAVDLTDEPVRNVTGDEAVPMLQSAAVEGATGWLTLTYDEALDPESVPASGAFTVKVNGAAVSLASGDRSDPPVRIRGAAVVLRLAAAVSVGQPVTVSYTAGTSPIRDFAGNAAANLSDRAVVNGVTASVEAGSAIEGSAVTFKAKLSAAVGSDVVLGWATGDDDTTGARQATSGTDYTAVTNGSVTIAANQTEASFTVTTTDDTTTEGDETFKVTISETTGSPLPSGVTIGTASAVGTIEDDDFPTALDIGKSVAEDTTLSFAAADFTGAFSGPDGRTLKSVTIVTLPDAAHGTLQAGAPLAAVIAGDSIAAAGLGTITFEPAANWNGTASFTYKVTDSADAESAAAATVTITVSAVDDTPTAANFSKSTDEDTTLTFAASDFTGAFSDPDGHTLKSVKVVTLPDTAHGTLKAGAPLAAVIAGDSIAAAGLGTITFEPAANWNGTASFTYQVTDSSDAESAAAATITIAVGERPSASDFSKGVAEDTTLSFAATDFTGAFSDPDGDTLKSVTVVTLPDATHGTLKAGDPLAAVSAGDSIAAADLGTITFEPAANWNGTASFTYKVTDSDDDESAAAATVSITVSAVDDAPSASNFSKSTGEDTTLTFAATDFTAAFSDPDGHTLKAVKIVTLPDATHGTLKAGAPLADVSAGDSIAAADLGTITFEPAVNWNGTASFTYKVTDSDDAESAAAATVSITVSAVDDAPSASNFGKSTGEDTTLTFAASDFTGAFSDPDGHTLKSVKVVTLPDATHGTLKAGDPLAAVSAGDSIAAAGLGTITFEPAANWNGTASFTYKVTDSDDAESAAAATVSITVSAVDDAPSASNFSKSTGEDTTLTFAATDFTAAFSDPDGHTLKSVTVVTLPTSTHGTLQAGAPLAAVSAGDSIAAAGLGTITFEPAANWNGTASFTYKVTDSDDDESAAAATVTITVSAVNDAPSAANFSKSTGEDTTLTFAATDFTGAFSDPDGHTLKSVKVVTLPDAAHGTLQAGAPPAAVSAGDSIAAADLGTITFEPAANWNGTASFTYKVTDSGDAESAAAATVTITVSAVDDRPSASDIGKSVAEDTTLSFAATDFTGAFSDPDGHTLKSVKVVTLPDATHGTLHAGAPLAAVSAGDSIAAAGLDTITFEPAANWNGTASFTYKVTDSDDAESAAAATVTITVSAVDDAPSASNFSKSTGEDTTLSFAATDFTGAFSDPDGHTLKSVTIATLPDSTHGTLKVGTADATAGQVVLAAELGTVSFEPAANWNGTASFTYKVTDSDDAESAAAATVSITVSAAGDPPTAPSLAKTIAEDTTLRFAASDFSGTFSDPDGPALKSVKIVTLPDPTHGILKVGARGRPPVRSCWPPTLAPSPSRRLRTGTVPASFSFTVIDSNDVESAAATFTITVGATPDRPTVYSFTKTIPEDTTLTFAASDFTRAFSDPDGHALKSVKIVTLPDAAHGILKVRMQAAASGQSVPAAGLGAISFAPVANWHGTASYSFTAVDSSGQQSARAATVTVIVTPVNDPPEATAGTGLTVDPGTTVTLDGSGSSDTEDNALTFSWEQTSGSEVTLEGAATASPSFIAPHAPDVLTFRLTVTDSGGLTASDTVTVTVRDTVPSFAGATVAALTLERDRPIEPVVLPAATGGNGALTYRLTSAPAGLAGLAFDAATRSLSGTPVTVGDYVFSYRADDADHNRTAADAALLTFAVAVEAASAERREAVTRTLAAVATQTLASALDNIGARFTDTIPATNLTVASERLPLAVPALASGTPGGAEADCSAAGSCADPFDTGMQQGRRVDLAEMLRNSNFSWTIDADEAANPQPPRLSLWGRGDLAEFAGRPDSQSSYGGNTWSGWLGADVRSGAWLAGVAVSHGVSEAEYRFGDASGERGRVETEMTALYPYGRWTAVDGFDLRTMLGIGFGDVRHTPDGLEPEATALSMWMVSFGVRQELPTVAGFDLGARADASFARLRAVDAPAVDQGVDGLSADTWRGRLGLEASRRFAVGAGATLRPFVELVGRLDGGDALTGTGLEVAGGVRFAGARLQVEAKGRLLATYTESGAQERGLSLTARLHPAADGHGLSLALTPRWGAGTGPAEALWRNEMPRLTGSGGGESALLDASVGFGFASPNGLLTPFAEGTLGHGENRVRLGARFKASSADYAVELSGERRMRADTAPEHRVNLNVTFSY